MNTPESAQNPGSFYWCLDRLNIAGNSAFSAVAYTVCDRWAVWPEQMLGRAAAAEAISLPDNPPLSTGLQFVRSQRGHVVMARRFAWHLAYEFTEAPTDVIASAFGNYTPETVAPWLKTPARLERYYPLTPQLLPALSNVVSQRLEM
jgi:hypothetical protein